MKLVYVIILVAALWLIQCLVGGTRLLFSLPSYSLLAAAGVLTIFSLRRSRPSPDRVCLLVSAIFFAYILGRAAWSPVTYLWWADFYMVLGCLAVYLLTALYVTHSKLRGFVIAGLLGIALVQVFIGIKQFSLGDNWMPFGFLRAENGRRASGMMISPIHFAGYLEAIGAMGLSIALWSTWRGWIRGLVGYIVVMCYVGVALSGSRGGYLSVACSLVAFVGISLWALHRVAPHRFRGTAIVSLVGLLLVAGIAFVAIQQSVDLGKRLDNLFGNKTGLRDMRFYNWQAALDQYRVSPVFGTGAGTHLYFGRYFRRPELQADPEHAHCDYLELLAEYGIVGAAGMAAFLFFHIANLRQAMACRTETPLPLETVRDNRLAIQIGVASAIAAYLAHSVVDFNLHIPANALLFAFFFGVAANPESAASGPESSLKAVRMGQVALLVLGGYILALGTPKLPGEYFCERARIALRQQDFATSVAFCDRALRWETQNPFIYYHLAGARAGLGLANPIPARRKEHFEKAVAAARAGLALFPADEHTLARLAGILHEAGRFAEAGAAFRAAITASPNLGRLHALYARHLALIGRHDEAVAALAEAKRLGASIDLAALLDETPQLSDEPGPLPAF